MSVTGRPSPSLFFPVHMELNNMFENDCESQYNLYDSEPDNGGVKIDPVITSPLYILQNKHSDLAYVRTGITMIDRTVRGLQRRGLSIWSGMRGSAKSTLLTEILLNAIDDGNKALLYSGEVTAADAMEWIYRQCAGPSNCYPTEFANYFVTTYETKRAIARWLEGKLFIYNNDYGHDFSRIEPLIESIVLGKQLDIVVLDNLMSLDISHIGREKGVVQSEIQAQTQFIQTCKRIAQRCDCHIAIVCHPRKASGFLRLDDVSGTGNLTNAADACFIVHRVNEDFKRLSRQTFGFREDAQIYQCDNVCEVTKDKQNGTQDLFIPLYFEVSTKRLKNSKSENRVYHWNTGGPATTFPSKADGRYDQQEQCNDSEGFHEEILQKSDLPRRF